MFFIVNNVYNSVFPIRPAAGPPLAVITHRIPTRAFSDTAASNAATCTKLNNTRNVTIIFQVKRNARRSLRKKYGAIILFCNPECNPRGCLAGLYLTVIIPMQPERPGRIELLCFFLENL